ncbi:MAG: FxsA family protein [Pelagibacteraceae bacterium]|tara:strand:- start:79 stop:504 length:426 start_codon:yes stop_codon:yes gene_type:complete
MQFTILFLIFIPLIEIYFMIKIGTVIGAFNTILATLLTAAVGLYFVRIQGISMLYSAANTVRNNQEPLKEILNGFCLIIAAILLIIPGFFTDTIGVLLLIPFSRNIILKIFGSDTNIHKKQDQNNTNTIEIQAEEIDERDK